MALATFSSTSGETRSIRCSRVTRSSCETPLLESIGENSSYQLGLTSRRFKPVLVEIEMLMSERTSKVVDVKQGDRNIIMTGKIMKISPVRELQTRYGPARVAAATLADETGSILLNLWRAQIDLVREGDFVKIENAFANAFRDNLELNIGSNGKIVIMSREGKQSTVEQSEGL
jgi:ssDNA-binding replication factor A large subunit